MKKIMGLALFAISIAAPASFAATMYGDLTINQVKCFRAPCPAIVRFSTGAGKDFAIDGEKGSSAARFLRRIRNTAPAGPIRVSVVGRIEREDRVVATEIRRAMKPIGPVGITGDRISGVLTAHKVMCNRAPCPAVATLTNNKGVTYSIHALPGFQAVTYLDHLNNTIGANEVRINVTVEGIVNANNNKVLEVTKITND